MIFFLGTISILQLFFIPGLIFNKSININESFIFKIISCVTVSIFINYILITSLIYLNIYNKEILYFIFFVEVLFLYKLVTLKKISVKFNLDILFITFLITVFLCFFAIYKNTGNVFYEWDAVVSYNEWAKKFYLGEYPGGMIRPYLIPKLWSMIYVFIYNNEIQFFSKFTTVIFPIIILLICLDEILIFKKPRDFIKLFLFLIFFYYHRNFILTGYVDIPLVAIITCCFYFIRRLSLNYSVSLTFVAAFLASTIKLSGIFIGVYLFNYVKNNYKKKIFFSSALIIYIFLLYKKQILTSSFGNIFNEMGQNDNFNFFIKLNYSFYLLKNSNLLFLLILSFFSIFIDKFSRNIFLIFIIPSLIYWSLFLSYDHRNMLFTVPALIITSSILIEYIFFEKLKLKSFFNLALSIKFLKETTIRINQKIITYLFILIFIVFIFIFNNQKITSMNNIKLNQIGNKEVSLILKKLIINNKLNSQNFVTDYQLIFFIPFFKNKLNWNDNFINSTKDLESFDYYLIYGHQNEARKIIINKINNNKSEILFEKSGFILVGKKE